MARVTTDVDTISQFMQWAGLLAVVSAGQLVVASVLLLVYSWQLALVVFLVFLPLFLTLRTFQRHVSGAYAAVRERIGDLLGAVSEAVAGATTVRAYAVEARTQDRIDDAIDRHRRAATRAQTIVAGTFSIGGLAAGLTNAAVITVGVHLGVGGDLTLGRLLAVLFIVTLFVQPVQVGTEVLNELQNAVAGWRRVLGVLDTAPDVADPGADGVTLPRGPIAVRFDRVSYAYPGRPGGALGRRRGAGARFAGRGRRADRLRQDDVRQAAHPAHGPHPRAGAARRRRPAPGAVREPARAGGHGAPGRLPLRGDAGRQRALRAAGGERRAGRCGARRAGAGRLGRPAAPRAGHRRRGSAGRSLSAGERQLVALARAYLADPDLLVLDEATSAVDPATEVRLQRALEGLTRGRAAVTVAHRLSTAEAADEVLVFDRGRLVERGTHRDLVGRGGVYAALHASWAAQRTGGG